jgi:hypothetical protein
MNEKENKIYKIMKTIDEKLEFGVEFNIYKSDGSSHTGNPFKFIQDGLYDRRGNKRYSLVGRLLTDDYSVGEKNWRPKKGDIYYIIDLSNDNGYGSVVYCNDIYDSHYFKKNITFKTKEEVIKNYKKLMECLNKIKKEDFYG